MACIHSKNIYQMRADLIDAYQSPPLQYGRGVDRPFCRTLWHRAKLRKAGGQGGGHRAGGARADAGGLWVTAAGLVLPWTTGMAGAETVAAVYRVPPPARRGHAECGLGQPGQCVIPNPRLPRLGMPAAVHARRWEL